jgi:hypothetical protein
MQLVGRLRLLYIDLSKWYIDFKSVIINEKVEYAPEVSHPVDCRPFACLFTAFF